MQQAGENFLGELVEAARARVARGYYAIDEVRAERRSLTGALKRGDRVPIIAEVKFRSPSEGKLAEAADAALVAAAYERGGASAVSVLTEPEHFDGSMEFLPRVKGAVGVPVLMKDIFVDEAQVVAAARGGADAILLIAGVFEGKGGGSNAERLIRSAHSRGLQVTLEVHDRAEYESAMKSEADVVGINNRDLRTLRVSLETSEAILMGGAHSKPVVCESGISTRAEVDRLRKLGADGFLVGSALMKSGDPTKLLGELSGK